LAIIAKAGIGAAAPAAAPAPAPAAPGSLVTGIGKDIRRIFIHCTATREGQDVSAATIRQWHLKQGWRDIGYHFVIRLDGTIERGRPENQVGSHVAGHNTGSIGVVYAGGLDAAGKAKDTRTPAQRSAMAALVRDLVRAYPGADVLGHRDIWPKGQQQKECPCFDVRSWWAGVAK
jgi:N-acetyl-anhydromuramyl-L-alanine amidase AmpD